jgi:hypothetical protein
VGQDGLAAWLVAATADAVVVRPDSIESEAQGNLWWLSLSVEEVATVSASEVEEVVRAIAAARGRWLTGNAAGPMIFYCWHDEQAGHLCLSLVSVNHGRLAFACEVAPVDDLDAIVRSFLASPYFEGVPWSELQSVSTEDATGEALPHVLPVWLTRVP